MTCVNKSTSISGSTWTGGACGTHGLPRMQWKQGQYKYYIVIALYVLLLHYMCCYCTICIVIALYVLLLHYMYCYCTICIVIALYVLLLHYMYCYCTICIVIALYVLIRQRMLCSYNYSNLVNPPTNMYFYYTTHTNETNYICAVFYNNHGIHLVAICIIHFQMETFSIILNKKKKFIYYFMPKTI